MPTKEQMDAVVREIEGIQDEARFRPEQSVAPEEEDALDVVPWEALSVKQRLDVLYHLDWSGFKAEEQAEVSIRVAEGDPPELWMDGIAAGDAWEYEKALADEIRADEHAARMRDGDPGDLATYEARRREAFATLDLPPLPPEMSPPTTEEVERAFAEIEASWNWSDDIGQMMRSSGLSPGYGGEMDR